MVDSTLAHGRARWLCDQLGARIRATMDDFQRPPAAVASEKQGAAVLDRIGRGWRTLSLGDWRPAPAERIWWLLGTDGCDYIEIRATHVGYRRRARHDYPHFADVRTRVRLSRHTLARLLQRQWRLDFPALHDELETCVHAFAPLFFASRRLGLQRFALPMATGLLVGDVGDQVLIARSWYSNLNAEYALVRQALAPLADGQPPQSPCAAALALAPLDEPPSSPTVDAWCDALAPFIALKEAFQPSVDPHEEFWEQAPTRVGVVAIAT